MVLFRTRMESIKEHLKDQQRKSFPRVVDFVISDYDEYVPFFERSLRYYMGNHLGILMKSCVHGIPSKSDKH